MFRTQHSVPQVYVEKSRDFQLLGRLIDCLQAGVKFDIDTILDITSPMNIRDNLLQLLCTKVGFFPTIDIDANILKYIVAAFPYIMKYKGTVKAIEYAVRTIIKSEYSTISQNSPPVIEIYDSNDPNNPFTIVIYTNIGNYSIKALDEIMKYIKPIGYSYEIQSYASVDETIDTLEANDEVETTIVSNSDDLGRITSLDNLNNPEKMPELSDDSKYKLGDVAYSIVVNTPIEGDNDETN